MEEVVTVTIFRNWVNVAATLKNDAERGKLYHAICEYSLYGKIPNLPPHLEALFNLMQPTINTSNKRKIAQQKKTQKAKNGRPANDAQSDAQSDVQSDAQSDVQSDVQNDVQNNSQDNLQNDVQNDVQSYVQNDGARARKKEKGKEKVKKRDTKVSPKEKISFAILLPDHLQNSTMEAKWKEWEDFRRKKGKPISEAAARMQMRTLKELDQEDAIRTIDQSIANDYQGLFPPRKAAGKLPGKDYSGI